MPRRSLRTLITAVLACLAGTALLATAGPGTAGAASNGRKVCPNFKYPGPTGKTLSHVTFNLSCATGKKIAIAQYRCRKVKDGSPGICKQDKRILGYKCFEQRLKNRGYYDGKVECTRGKKVSVFVYRQPT